MKTAIAENLATSRRTRSISVESTARACINCQYYEQYWRNNRRNITTWVPTSEGYCLKNECHRGALRQPCKHFLKEK